MPSLPPEATWIDVDTIMYLIGCLNSVVVVCLSPTVATIIIGPSKCFNDIQMVKLHIFHLAEIRVAAIKKMCSRLSMKCSTDQ